ncbi:hypothetical protein OVA29_01725 [Exiguobacterium sp. SL14]|nr:hypothetical protein [Exiguobacterium sp. SL14]MCY1689719.1 hypothetical protein [Exiguobacterium sp. SL14]
MQTVAFARDLCCHIQRSSLETQTRHDSGYAPSKWVKIRRQKAPFFLPQDERRFFSCQSCFVSDRCHFCWRLFHLLTKVPREAERTSDEDDIRYALTEFS